MHMELDTGAGVTVTSEQQCKQLFPNVPLESYMASSLYGYSGQHLQVTRRKRSASTIQGTVTKITSSGDCKPQKTNFTGM